MTDVAVPDVTTQPIAAVQWLDRETLRGNDYNPNHVAPPELKLLKLSILEDGWTQPIVARPADDEEGAYEIVDGFHRWTVSGDPEVAALTGGLVPVVILRPDPAHRRLSTVRHNRARGTHHVVKMADLVFDLVDLGLDEDEIRRRLGMDREEVRRLLERGKMTVRGAGEEFGEAWRPAPKE